MNYGKLTAGERAQINTDALAKVTVNQGYIDAFKPALKGWRPEYGSKPTDPMLHAGVILGNKHARPGVEGLYIAMLLRPEGCISQTQFQLAATPLTGKAVGPANNKRKALVNAKVFHETSYGGKPACLHLVLMPAGIKALEAYTAAQVTAATPDSKVTSAKKPRKAKAKKPVADAPVAEATVEAAVAQAIADTEASITAMQNIEPTS